MATRYSGNLRITCTYDDRGRGGYKCTVTPHGNKYGHTVYVRPAPAGFGPGISYDSPEAYDEIAHAAISFADNEQGGLGDEAEFNADGSGYKIYRRPPSYSPYSTGKKKAERGGGGGKIMRAIGNLFSGTPKRRR